MSYGSPQILSAAGSSVQPTAPQPNPSQSGNSGELGLLATTTPVGVPLINGTQTILSWTAPQDGQLHRVEVFCTEVVTNATTAGITQVTVNGTATTLISGGQAVGSQIGQAQVILQPGGTITIRQNTAMTAGAATVYAELWGS